jgi:hypothetical protein
MPFQGAGELRIRSVGCCPTLLIMLFQSVVIATIIYNYVTQAVCVAAYRLSERRHCDNNI